MRLSHGGLYFVAFCCLAPRTLFAQSLLNQNSDALKPGILVEDVAKGSEAEKAGIKTGDILLRWSRGDSAAQLESPLDLMELEVEQASRGAVVLTGSRSAENKVWSLGEGPGGSWGIVSRPNLTGKLLSQHEEAKKMAAAGKVTEAAELWRVAAEDAKTQHLPAAVSAWLFSRLFRPLADAHKTDQADAVCTQEVQAIGELRPELGALWARYCGDLFIRQNDLDRTEKYYQLGLQEIRKTGEDRVVTGVLLSWLGYVARLRDQVTKSQDLGAQAVKILEQQVPDSLVLASSLNRLGLFMQDSGQLEASKPYLARGLTIVEKRMPDTLTLASRLENMGDTFTKLGDLDEAERYLTRAQRMIENLAPDSLNLAACLIDMSNVAWIRGDWATDEMYLRRALAIQTKLAPRADGAVSSMNNLGNLLRSRGQFAEAEKYLMQSLAIKKETSPNSLDVAETLMNLGLLKRDQGDLQKAEEYLRQGLAVHETLAPKGLRLGENYYALGTVAAARRDFSAAEDYYRKSLAIDLAAAPGALETANTFVSLGDTLRAEGGWEEAEKNYQEAAKIMKILAPASADHAEALRGLALTARHAQRLDEAAQLFDQALSAVESMTTRVGASEVRAGFRAGYVDYYKDYIDLLVAQGKPDLALQVLERSRARTMLEMLTEAQLEIHKGVDPSLLKEERTMRQNIAAKSDRRLHLLSGEHTEQQIATVDGEIKDLLEQHQAIANQIRATSPSYAALTQPQTLSATEIQQRLLDKNTLLLEYSLGEERSYVFAVTQDSLEAYPLPKRAAIEDAAQHVYDLLTAPNRRNKDETSAQRRQRIAQAQANYPKAAAQLGRMLVGPIASRLKERRLLIVSDGALHYVPFAALPVSRLGKAPVPLVAEHEIVNLPSASVLSLLRQERVGRKPATKTVAVLADPVFNRDDVRVKPGAREPRAQSDVKRGDGELPGTETEGGQSDSLDFLTRSADDVDGLRKPGGELYLPRLPYSRQEAEVIAAGTPAGQTLEALDFKANRATATSPELGKYRIVHFATHALLNNKHPELSGLVLSLVNEDGESRNGFLALQDIYNLDLPVELVVLSGCETGLGKKIEGEGLIGLTRGFMYAGASRVVASLWNIEDQATAQLMGHFYRGMIGQGMRPAAALRSAQLQMWKQKRWSSPYFWAGFQIQGDWK